MHSHSGAHMSGSPFDDLGPDVFVIPRDQLLTPDNWRLVILDKQVLLFYLISFLCGQCIISKVMSKVVRKAIFTSLGPKPLAPYRYSGLIIN